MDHVEINMEDLLAFVLQKAKEKGIEVTEEQAEFVLDAEDKYFLEKGLIIELEE